MTGIYKQQLIAKMELRFLVCSASLLMLKFAESERVGPVSLLRPIVRWNVPNQQVYDLDIADNSPLRTDERKHEIEPTHHSVPDVLGLPARQTQLEHTEKLKDVPISNEAQAPTINIMGPGCDEKKAMASTVDGGVDMIGELGHAVSEAQTKAGISRQQQQENAEILTLEAEQKANDIAEEMVKSEEQSIAADNANAAREESMEQAEKRRHEAEMERLENEASGDEKKFAVESRALRAAIGAEEKVRIKKRCAESEV
eukprot:Gregarina_sp_Poly_1__4305@NODE_233_length_11059_cov_49_751365_g206_i0_p4_GENE_NODE_233_length_11059_cov_49_751365_g206_i0NODE_233_length_11059_cov_49_751365_g206_i0_p4_ORF_typecomplete_len257_score53_99PBPTp47_a/PF14889_6/0_074Maf/PF02545_14/7_6e03Maf/PF02545_14/0_081AAA_23/PF13476_6/0_39Phlebovirus_NSM/PF07246_11/1_5BSP_II/PF05432_11/3_6Borrelia_P83/PF05262_11/4_2MAT1/PF06391_13/8_8_NODE_233_length_11059_cov_49_751365_g206_i048075577